jgi:hypothetical protein
LKWKSLVNQSIGLLLIVTALIILCPLPFTLAYQYQGIVSSTTICAVWDLITFILFVLSTALIAWISVERYLLIYHEHFINCHRIAFHYFPLVFLILYLTSFYVGLVIFYPCQEVYNVYDYLCTGPCYIFENTPLLIDWSINSIFVIFVAIISNLALLIRIIVQTQRMKGIIITAASRQQWV